MITCKNLSYQYGKNKLFSGISLEVAPGECLVLAGPNGTGKTTLLSLLAGIAPPKEGERTVTGSVGYVPQGCALLEDATVRENIAFFARLSREPFPDTLPFRVGQILGKRVSSLSGGLKKQVSIAAATVGPRDNLLLDEPCAALDISFREELIEWLAQAKKKGMAIVFVSHDPTEFFPIFDKILFVGSGEGMLKKSELGEIGESEEKFTEYFKNQIKKGKRN